MHIDRSLIIPSNKKDIEKNSLSQSFTVFHGPGAQGNSSIYVDIMGQVRSVRGFWKAEMQDALFRAWHCRACKSKLLHRRAVRRFNEACFQDGPALVCEVNDQAGRGARLQGS